MKKAHLQVPAETPEDEELLAPKGQSESWKKFNMRVEKSEKGRALCEYVQFMLYPDAASALYTAVALKIKEEDRKLLRTDYTYRDGFRLVRYIAHKAKPANKRAAICAFSNAVDYALGSLAHAFDKDTSSGRPLSTTFLPELNRAVCRMVARIRHIEEKDKQHGCIYSLTKLYVGKALQFIDRDPRYATFTRLLCDDYQYREMIGPKGNDLTTLRRAVMRYERTSPLIFDGTTPKITAASSTMYAMSAAVTSIVAHSNTKEKELTFVGKGVNWKLRGKGGAILGTVKIPADDDRCYHCLCKLGECKGSKGCPEYSDPWSMQCRAMWQRRRQKQKRSTEEEEKKVKAKSTPRPRARTRSQKRWRRLRNVFSPLCLMLATLYRRNSQKRTARTRSLQLEFPLLAPELPDHDYTTALIF